MKRRTTLTATLVAATLFGAHLGVPAQAVEVNGTEETITIPGMESPDILTIGTTTNRTGDPIAVIASSGVGGQLSVVNLKTNTRVAEGVLDKDAAAAGTSINTWGAVTLSEKSNGNVVLATTAAGAYMVDANTYEITKLSPDDASGYSEIKTNIKDFWDITRDDNDNVYFAGYAQGGARVSALNPHQKTWTDLSGVIDPNQRNSRSIAYEAGKLYVGMGSGDIYSMNTDGSGRTKLAFNPGSEITYLEAKAGRLYATTATDTCDGGTCVINIQTGNVEGKLKTGQSRVITRPGENTKTYYLNNSGKRVLNEYDPTTGNSVEVTPGDTMLPSRLGRNSWATREVVVAGAKSDGAMAVYNTATKSLSTTASEHILPGVKAVQSLAAGPDGQLYGGFYMTGTEMLKFDPAAQAATTISGAPEGQIEGFATAGNKLVAGLYTGARIGVFDTSQQKWVHSDPKAFGGVQDRPYAMVGIDNTRVAVGTVPTSSKLGGGFGIFNTETNKFEHSTPMSGELEDLAPVSVAYRDGKVYVGTSIRGGLGIAPSKQEARIFVYDVAAKKIIGSATVPGKPTAINALAFDDSGKLYGSTGAAIHEFDTTTLASVRSHGINGGAPEANRSQLIFHKGTLFGIAGDQVHAVNPNNFADQKSLAAHPHVVGLTVDNSGNLFYAAGGTIYRYRIS